MANAPTTLRLAACFAALAGFACSDSDNATSNGPGADAGTQADAAGGGGWVGFNGPGFLGAGTSGAGMGIAAGIDSVSCGDDTGAFSTQGPAPGQMATLLCFFGDDPDQPAASIEWVVETASDDELVHVRLTLDPSFVDNSFGENQIGWDHRKKGRPLQDLVKSDHAEIMLTDANGEVILAFKVDYISEDDSVASGYSSLGVTGGDGEVITGDAADVVEVSTSLDRNFNACGLSQFAVDSPASNSVFEPSMEAPEWDYRVVYDVWVRRDAFGAAGFGQALIETVHASPSKGDDSTVEVTPGECPPTWNYCNNPDGCAGEGGPPDGGMCDPLDNGCGGGGTPPPPPPSCADDPDSCDPE